MIFEFYLDMKEMKILLYKVLSSSTEKLNPRDLFIYFLQDLKISYPWFLLQNLFLMSDYFYV